MQIRPNWPYQWTMDMVHPSISSLASITFLNFCFAFIIAVDKRWLYVYIYRKEKKCSTFTFTSNQKTILTASKEIILAFYIKNKKKYFISLTGKMPFSLKSSPVPSHHGHHFSEIFQFQKYRRRLYQNRL